MEPYLLRSRYHDFLITTEKGRVSWYYANYPAVAKEHDLIEIVNRKTRIAFIQFHSFLYSPILAPELLTGSISVILLIIEHSRVNTASMVIDEID